MFDITELPPAPWVSEGPWLIAGRPIAFISGKETGQWLDLEKRDTVAAACADMRNALAVQLERGWGTRFDLNGEGFCAVDRLGTATHVEPGGVVRFWPDPVTAILKADEWVKGRGERPAT